MDNGTKRQQEETLYKIIHDEFKERKVIDTTNLILYGFEMNKPKDPLTERSCYGSQYYKYREKVFRDVLWQKNFCPFFNVKGLLNNTK